MALIRLQKILAQAGLASRRGAEEMISAGRVKVDGRVVSELGVKVDTRRQKVLVDGEPVEEERKLYVLFHKPRGVVCTMSDPEGRPTVAEYVHGVTGRVVPVGRLDYSTSGVLLLTNDGEFAATMLHPKQRVPKVYVAKVRGRVLDEGLEVWRTPIEIDGKMTSNADVRRLRWEEDKTWLEITLREGKNRHIHRLGEATGNDVFRLARLSFGGINHEGLRPGSWRYLSKDELVALKRVYGVPRKIWPAPALPNHAKLRTARASALKSRGTKQRRIVGAVDGTPSARRRRHTERLARTASGKGSFRQGAEAASSTGEVRGGGETSTTNDQGRHSGASADYRGASAGPRAGGSRNLGGRKRRGR